MWKILYSLTLPGGVMLGLVALLLQYSLLPQPAAMRWYALVVFAVATFLGWRFNRSRVLFAVVTLAAASLTLAFLLPALPVVSRHVVLDSIALLLPLNILALTCVKERGNNSMVIRLCSAWIVAQIAAVGWAATYAQEYARPLLRFSFVSLESEALSRIPQPAMVAFLIALGVVAYRFLRGRRPIEHGLFWSLVAVFLAFESVPALYRITYFTGAGAILIGALIENSHMLAYRDELTGLAGRRALNERLLKLEGSHVIAMVDVDHFKKFNDTFGHECGDQALRMVAARLAAVTGGGEAFRYGGEEFTIVFPEKTMDEAMSHLERMRGSIEATTFKVRGSDRRRKKGRTPIPSNGRRVRETCVTVSIGVAGCPESATSERALYSASDEALYVSKNAGRDRVSVAPLLQEKLRSEVNLRSEFKL